MKYKILIIAILAAFISPGIAQNKKNGNPFKFESFGITDNDFIFNGKPTIIRCGEMHFARIPREYWKHRLQMAKAMGLNSVCAYLFWNFHEPQPGKFNWEGMADAAEFCRLAKEEGLMVILRPGPYSCAEWEMGGFPWWLLKNKEIKLRTQDKYYLECCRNYLKEVGRVLSPLQITNGGPIIMVQVENEYGSFGEDKEYIGKLHTYLKEGGFNVPFFTSDGPDQLKSDVRDDIFSVVNFGGDPEGCFKYLREARAKGPLMCGEYYPAWFDSWGIKHHTKSVENIVKDLSYMLENNASFSIYMVHGGTSFGIWSGANCPPFLPQTSSYDYDAPISEAGWDTPKFQTLRDMFQKYLPKGEKLPAIPKRNPVIIVPEFSLNEIAPVFDNLGKSILDNKPRNFEEYNLGYGSAVYRTKLPPGDAGKLLIKELHDYGIVYLDGEKIATLDRRYNQSTCNIPKRSTFVTLDIYIEAMGRVNYGSYMHDRKGITEKVEFLSETVSFEPIDWEVFLLPAGDDLVPKNLIYKSDTTSRPAYYRGDFILDKIGDTFFDVSTWGKGLVWVNGHCLGRFWNIGPTQTLYVPAPWLHMGKNEVIILDIIGTSKNSIQGLSFPILDQLNSSLILKKNRKPNQNLDLTKVKPIRQGTFPNSNEWQDVTFNPAKGRFFCLEALDNTKGDDYTSCAELYLLDENGKQISRDNWKVVYADSEETDGDDGRADNIFDLQFTSYWHTEWQENSPKHPHQVVIDLGESKTVSGMRYLPRQDNANGRIKNYRIYLNENNYPGI